VVRAMDAYGRILDFLDPRSYVYIFVSAILRITR
jgi:hypothetical protein